LYLAYIDGLRAFAVLSVFIYHLHPELLPGGFSGVDVFFVVSGYVVSLSLDKQRGVNLRTFLAVFYSRRVKRILPALIFCLLVTIFFTALFVPYSHLSSSHQKTALYAFFGLSNIILASGNDDYFGPLAEFNPFTHTWSLGVEEQFYVAFPFIFILWVSGSRKFYKKLSVIIFAGLLLASLGAAYWYSNTNKLYEYYLIFSRFWQLAVGILLYQFVKSTYESKLKPYTKTLNVLTWFSLGLVLAGFVVSDETRFPIPWAFVGVSGTALLLLSMHYVHGGPVRALLENRVLSIIGKMSYSLYLWHWPVIVLFRWTIGLDSAAKYFAVIALTFAMSAISYLFVETPVRTNPIILKTPRFAVIATGLLILGASSYAGNTMFSKSALFTISATKNRTDWMVHSYDPNQEKGLLGIPTVLAEPFDAGAVRYRFGRENSNQTQKIFILGDSHANAYVALFRKLSAKTGKESILYTRPGCGDIINHTFATLDPICTTYWDSAIDDISLLSKQGDVLFLPSLKLQKFTEQWEKNNEADARRIMQSVTTKAERAAAIKENIQNLSSLADKGISIIYEAPKPIFKSPPFRCSEWFNTGNPICRDGLTISKEELQNYRLPVMNSLNSISDELKNAYVYDPLDVLCPGETCASIVEGKPLFFDGDHLSAYGNMVVYDDFIGFLQKVENSSSPAIFSQTEDRDPAPLGPSG